MGKICSYILSFLASDVLRYRKSVVRRNLLHAFPTLGDKERKEIERKFYRHLGEVVCESLSFGKYRGKKGKERLRLAGICTMEPNRSEYEAMDGMMVLTSHCGNWEMMGGWFAYCREGSLGYSEGDITVVYKRLRSPFWDRVMSRRRLGPLMESGFDGYVESREVLRYALEHKGEKKVYVFPTDQYPYRGAAKRDVKDFFGEGTLTMTGGAALAHKLGMGVVYMSVKRREEGGYAMAFETICRDASGMEPSEIMDRYYALLQRDIKAQSENWLWSHKRWKNLYDYKH